MWCKEILEVLQAKEVELTAENQIDEYILVGVATICLQAYVDEIKVSTLSHTRQPSLFSRESPSLEGSLLISPFLPISSLFWI